MTKLYMVQVRAPGKSRWKAVEVYFDLPYALCRASIWRWSGRGTDARVTGGNFMPEKGKP